MRSNNHKSTAKHAGFAAAALLLASGAAFAQQQVNLTAGYATTTLPDGTVVPMWGYTCGAAVAGSTASCTALNKAVAAAAAAGTPLTGVWSPVVITVPTGQDLTINLTNNLSFLNSNSVPTSLVIVGQLGGGLGGPATSTLSPDHTNAQPVTWPIAGTPPGATPVGVGTPPVQGPRVQSFATEVPGGTAAAGTAGATNAASLCFGACGVAGQPALKPGTYLIESGTHPSIQGPMGLYGMVVVTCAPGSTACTSPGTAYPAGARPAVTYNADIPLLLSEIDPLQNSAVNAAVNTAGFNETNVWSGQPGGCGNPLNADNTPNTSYGTCYPPAVNYTPLYYLVNGSAFDKTTVTAASPPSLFAAAPASGVTGTVLVRLVNAGLRMHVPSIVGATTGGNPSAVPPVAASSGFALIAEDGNVLPGVPRVQNEVFMAAGKTTDVMINVPASATAPALPIYDRELSLSANAVARDAGMLAYISVNGAGLPASGAFSAAATAVTANPDHYFVVGTNTLVVADPAKGLLANDVNVFGAQVQGTVAGLTLNADGTFTYSGPPTTFTYCGNGQTTGSACALVTLAACTGSCQEAAGGITTGNSSYTANASFLKIQPPGILAAASDAAGYPLTVNGVTGVPAAVTLTVDPNGGFNASTTTPGTYTFQYTAKNSQGTVSTTSGTVTLIFPAASGVEINVLDGKDVLAARTNPAITPTVISDYRWIIEEDRTFYVNPNCTTNPPPAGCPGAATAGIGTTGIVPTFGTNFHTSYMPLVAAGCTGQLSCEGGQTIYDPTTGGHVLAVCDQGNGICRPDTSGNGFAPHWPREAHLDPTKRYYLTVFPGDAGNPFANANLSADCTNGTAAATNPGACGHGMGGAPLTCTITPPATTCSFPTLAAPLTVLTEPDPYPPAKLSVFVFEDDFPLNGEYDAGGGIDVLSPNERGLGGFNITLFDDAGGTGDATGQMTYDMFNQPLVNSLAGTIDPATGLDACPVTKIPRIGPQLDANGNPIPNTLDPTQTGITGTIVTCPNFESDGQTLSPLAGQAVIANLMPGRYGVVATPGADRIARGEEWLQTNTLDGQKAHDSFLRIGEPSFFQEFGPAGYHVSIGFASPKIINNRLAGICAGTDPNSPQAGTPYTCTSSVSGVVTAERMSRTPDERLYSSGDNSSFSFTQCYVSIGDADGEDFAFTKCDANGRFSLSGLPDGDWRITVFDQWNDMLVDGLSTPVRLAVGAALDMGEIATSQWQANIYTSTFFDANGNGVRDATESGLTLVPTNIRFRDGSYSNFNNTDLSGNAGFNEVFPLFSWYVIETDTTRYKNTGTHVVYDAGGPADGTCTSTTAPCGSSTIGANMANTFETVSVPTALQVPGAVYCDNADCNGFSIATPGTSAPPSSCTINPTSGATNCTSSRSTGRIDPPWVVAEGWQGFSGQNSFLEFGKAPFAAGENGGIHGEVIYASTRPFDDPQLLLHTSWTPDVPGVTINLYQVGTGADGTQTLTLVDTTKTTSWDDWAQGFYAGTNKPYMNCPGQLAQPTTASSGDLFFFTLFNQPMWLDLYNNGGTPAHTIPNNSQFKCYDGMHNWNQLQPAYYDGAYYFPSIIGRNPTTGVPTGAGSTNGVAGSRPGSNCTICVPNPVDGTPMLPSPGQLDAHGNVASGKYVVEMIVPPGYELVKEEDKNILIGDNYIAPVTVQFPGLGGAIYIMPDQASVSAVYNANQGSLSAYNASNAQNPTQAFGRISSLPSHEGDTGSVETFWPCVGATRIVPDYISLFPQSAEVAPFAGARRNLCDRKLVQLDDQTSALAKFWIFTSAHVAAHFTGVITDDFTSEFDPFSPQFGEKFSPANLPVAIKDWTGQEISRVYSDEWGTYDGLTYSTWEVNPPNPTGYAPTMMVTCMNDAGSGPTPDPLFNPAYSQFCYEIPFMPGQTQYMDTPVVPTSAFAGAGYNNPDCDYPDATPAISEVDVDSNLGPWAAYAGGGSAGAHQLFIYALGTVPVNNYAYSGPSATVAPFNAKTATRRYSFGTTPGSVAVVGSDGVAQQLNGITTWSDGLIQVTVPANILNSSTMNCPIQQQLQYGGPASSSPAKCAQLVITAANGKQSVDAVTITIGGKAPKHITPTASIQKAIDAAMPGDMLMIDPLVRATSSTPATAAVHEEMLLMWKPVRLQGVGAVASVINANTHPAGKLDVWRREVNCLFGLSLDGYQSLPGGTPFTAYDPSGAYNCAATGANFGDGSRNLVGFQPTSANPQVDRLPLEAVIGWNASLNGNLAELLQEPSLMGALEGAAITVLAKGVHIPPGSTDVFGAGAATAGTYPAGTLLLTNTTDANRGCGANTSTAHNPFPSNFLCNPSGIDGLTIENSSQGGGGVFVHGWGHYIQIANNRVTNNAGTLSGGINVGQGEFPGAYTIGGINADPGSCQTTAAPNPSTTGSQLPYCFDVHVTMQHNMVSKNSSTGDELFSATPAGAGGVSICNGSDFYKFNYNWVCGNLSTGDGGGLGHIGYSYNGDIEHNSILFNQSTNPTIPTNGGGILVMGAPDVDPTCGATTDLDCLSIPPTAPGDGVGPGLVINANLIQGNAAESGSGGGLRLQGVNGTDVLTFPTAPVNWYAVQVTNNIINNNVAGWDGGGISLYDALNVNIINNTIMSNDTTASAGVLFNTIGAPLASSQGPCTVPRNPDGTCPNPVVASTRQPAGIVAIENSSMMVSNLPATIVCPAGHFTGSATNGQCRRVSFPELFNNVIYDNRTFNLTVGGLGTGPINQQNVVTLVPTLSQPTADATAANGGGVIVTGGTGACVTTGTGTGNTVAYWDIGVRGDTGPTNHASGFTLNPTYSVLTDVSALTGYGSAGAHNSQANPTVLHQYCNGSRVPPENGGLGYDVPPGISDATVPNPIFNLTPAVTVDEGNNWINIAWGPLSLVNTSNGSQNGVTLGNYGPAASSPVINFIPSTGAGAANYAAAPSQDFYGTNRKNGFVDAGAVEFTGGGGGATAVLNVTGGPLAFGNQPTGTTSATQNLTLHNTGTAGATGVAVVISAPFTRVTTGAFPGGAPNCTATLAAGANCTVKVAFAPTALGAANGSATFTANVTVSGSPVTLTGTGVAPVVSASLTPPTWTTAATRGCTATALGGGTCPLQTFTLTNTGNVTLTGIGQGTLGGANASEFSITRALSTCGPAGGGQLLGQTTLAPGGVCVITGRFTPLTTQTTGVKNATLSVTDAAGTQSSALTGTAN